jgi:hypothetical protein
MRVPLRYLVGGILIFLAGLVPWLGQPAYFGYLDANYAWIVPLSLVLVSVGAWLCVKELIAATDRK